MSEKGIEIVQKEAAGMLAWASGLTIASREDYAAAVAEVGRIKAARSRITYYWSSAKAAAYDAWKDIVAREKQMTDICDRAEAVVRSKALAWKAEADRQRRPKRRGRRRPSGTRL